MFRIRRIFDDTLPLDQRELGRIQEILREQFPGVREEEIVALPDKLRNPIKYGFRSLLYVADKFQGQVRGFALVLHEPVLKFCFLDFIATASKRSGAGVGGALYERAREECRALGIVGLFFECLPDEPKDAIDPVILRQNIARLRFYERYGARPIIHTGYQEPARAGDTSPQPFLMFDSLGEPGTSSRATLRKVIRTILERKYAFLCPPEYVNRVVNSVLDDPIELRPPRYIRTAVTVAASPVAATPTAAYTPGKTHIVLVVNDKHDIHHVREQGYVESPIRISAILKEIEPTGLFVKQEPREFPEAHIRAAHDGKLVDYIKKACAAMPPGQSLYPYVFPIRNNARPPKETSVLAGYFCMDTFTPINMNAFPAARRGVDCTLTAADAVLKGERLAYALVRPPGHHAEDRAFGGFCYFNNNAIAANYFCKHGRVAILDIDYHHGNGQERIFFRRNDVLTVSIHGHPKFAYPYFSGFEDEVGEDAGHGFNVNYPMPEAVDGPRYRQTLKRALDRIRAFEPRFLVVALGLDPAKGDPTGTWSLTAGDFLENGRMIGAMKLPTLVVQEGGYKTRTLGTNARHFFEGLVQGTETWPGTELSHDKGKERPK